LNGEKFVLIRSLLIVFCVAFFSLTGCAPQIKTPQNGEQTTYHYKGGPILSVKNYENGLLHGKFKTYYKNGVVRTQGEYVKGKIEGRFYRYAQTGQLAGWADFKNGKMNKQEKLLK